jgi:hypothetical protein
MELLGAKAEASFCRTTVSTWSLLLHQLVAMLNISNTKKMTVESV